MLDPSDPWIPKSDETPRRGAIPVRFFGTYDFAWIENQRAVCPYRHAHAEHSSSLKQQVCHSAASSCDHNLLQPQCRPQEAYNTRRTGRRFCLLADYFDILPLHLESEGSGFHRLHIKSADGGRRQPNTMTFQSKLPLHGMQVFLDAMAEAEHFELTQELPNGFNEETTPTPEKAPRKTKVGKGKGKKADQNIAAAKSKKRGNLDESVLKQRYAAM